MKQALIIFSLLIFGCSTRKGQSAGGLAENSLEAEKDGKAKFTLVKSNHCEQSKLSNQFDLSIDFKRYSDTIEQRDSCFLTVYVKDKRTKATIDHFSMESSYLFSFMFLSCDSMTSYTTKFKADRTGRDNYFGDIVVEDFNFDGIEDIAVINDAGGNSGPFYSFYIQNNAGKFKKDDFLTDSVSVYPSEINSKNKTLATYGHAGACGVGKHTFKLDKIKNTWTVESYRRIGECE